MFTGIIAQIGTVQKKRNDSLVISAEKDFLKFFSVGLSISINGICLTVVSFDTKTFTINFMQETTDKTNIGSLKARDIVNLELPATIDTFLSGHIVQGHVDCVATIEKIAVDGNSHVFVFSIPKEFTKYLVAKGSITVNGISLTIIESKEDTFSVGIIPHTWEKTMLHTAKVGDSVNIEVDVLAKYIEKLLKK